MHGAILHIDDCPSDGATDSLACRVSPTPVGLAGVPTVEQIVEALRALGALRAQANAG
ncbi:hypothetical protein [Agromyces cerinus]|uniref:Uncharacterized protein n=1 Tax=Agromyces cerinus subsp. cerinus TaxID=232089 RepID=A0A1N6EPQ0_9MICO|nr:hypothetical protein [Agromyces cerinus]SIN85069.1 hypothetical protein SAMN05443544_1353 [Agromyces cerinus subsp. cerinus]